MPLGTKKPDSVIVRNSLDKWDGYPAARGRLIKAITDRKLTNVVVASGDAHVHAVGRVPLRDDELDGPAVATEFLGTSITSGGNGAPKAPGDERRLARSEEHTSELQSLMRISYAVFCLKKKKTNE